MPVSLLIKRASGGASRGATRAAANFYDPNQIYRLQMECPCPPRTCKKKTSTCLKECGCQQEGETVFWEPFGVVGTEGEYMPLVALRSASLYIQDANIMEK